MNKFKAEFYQAKDGTKPAKIFMLSQDEKMKAKLFGLVDVLEQYGNALREPYSKPLANGIFELRAKAGTKPCEIERAKEYRKDFLERNGK